MNYETLFDGTKIPKIGLGTWTMGGRHRPNPSEDDRALNALRAAFEMWYTHIDTAEMYANGHTEELVGRALRDFNRADFFITTKVRPPKLRYADTLDSIDGSLRCLGVDTIDLFLVHWRDSTPLGETFRALNEAVRAGKIRYVGVSNFDVSEMEESQKLSETPIVTNQVPYSVTTRDYVRNGVVEYCQANDILVTAYSPVEEGGLDVVGELSSIADAHGATPYQIALAWLVQQPKVITIPMSHSPKHLRENLASAEITLTDEEMDRLTNPS